MLEKRQNKPEKGVERTREKRRGGEEGRNAGRAGEDRNREGEVSIIGEAVGLLSTVPPAPCLVGSAFTQPHAGWLGGWWLGAASGEE